MQRWEEGRGEGKLVARRGSGRGSSARCRRHMHARRSTALPSRPAQRKRNHQVQRARTWVAPQRHFQPQACRHHPAGGLARRCKTSFPPSERRLLAAPALPAGRLRRRSPGPRPAPLPTPASRLPLCWRKCQGHPNPALTSVQPSMRAPLGALATPAHGAVKAAWTALELNRSAASRRPRLSSGA